MIAFAIPAIIDAMIKGAAIFTGLLVILLLALLINHVGQMNK